MALIPPPPIVSVPHPFFFFCSGIEGESTKQINKNTTKMHVAKYKTLTDAAFEPTEKVLLSHTTGEETYNQKSKELLKVTKVEL